MQQRSLKVLCVCVTALGVTSVSGVFKARMLLLFQPIGSPLCDMGK